MKMSGPTKVIDVLAVLGVKVICEDVPAEKLIDKPMSVEAQFSPGASSNHHIHPMQDESYQVLSGTLDLFLDNQWHKVEQGQSISIPKGKVHAFRNSTNGITKTINAHDPGLRFQEYLEVMEKLIKEGKVTNMTGLRSGIFLSLHSLEFSNEFVPVQPPYWLIKLLAGIGRLLGYKL
jgi:quercetin dioxygenase-like cupin family protein